VAGDPEELVRSFFETLSSGDLDRVATFFDSDSVWTVCATEIPGAGTHRGSDIVEEFLRPVRGMFEPGQPKVELTNMVANDRWVAVEAVGRGRFRGGPDYENRYSFWVEVEVEGGTIRTIREYMDSHYVATLAP
jgi:ketosteroid isomerase-like protein